MKVPFFNMERKLEDVRGTLRYAVENVIDSGVYILGPKLAEFERKFAEHCGAEFAVGVSSGTSALKLALECLRIKEGDEVIVPANTFQATADAVVHAGARPVLIDADEDTFCIDIGQLEKKIEQGDNVKAIMPVHLYGQACDMDKIIGIANRWNIKVVADACQAHNARHGDFDVGCLGDAAAYSFYPSKNLGALGDAGAVTTNDANLAEKIKMSRNYGQRSRYHHEFISDNARLDEIQAAMLDTQLPFLDEWCTKRRNNADIYNAFLADVDEVKTPVESRKGYHVYHLYVIRARDRDGLQKHLEERGVTTLIHYLVPIHLQEAYSKNGLRQFNLGHSRGDFPVAEMLAREILSLPMDPWITTEEIRHVCDSIKDFYTK